MKAEEIRNKEKEAGTAIKGLRDMREGSFILLSAQTEMLIEIAAQLAELNETLRKKAGE